MLWLVDSERGRVADETRREKSCLIRGIGDRERVSDLFTVGFSERIIVPSKRGFAKYYGGCAI